MTWIQMDVPTCSNDFCKTRQQQKDSKRQSELRRTWVPVAPWRNHHPNDWNPNLCTDRVTSQTATNSSKNWPSVSSCCQKTGQIWCFTIKKNFWRTKPCASVVLVSKLFSINKLLNKLVFVFDILLKLITILDLVLKLSKIYSWFKHMNKTSTLLLKKKITNKKTKSFGSLNKSPRPTSEH